MFDMARTCDIIAGDLTWRATRTEWQQYLRDGVQLLTPPPPIIQPRTSRDYRARIDWKGGGEYMIDCIMIGPEWTTEGGTSGPVPADIGTHRMPMRLDPPYGAAGIEPEMREDGLGISGDWRHDAKAHKMSKDDGANMADKVEEWARMLVGRMPGRAPASAQRAPAWGGGPRHARAEFGEAYL